MYFNATDFGLFVLILNLTIVLAHTLISFLTKANCSKSSIVSLILLGFFPPLNVIYFFVLLVKLELKKKSEIVAG